MICSVLGELCKQGAGLYISYVVYSTTLFTQGAGLYISYVVYSTTLLRKLRDYLLREAGDDTVFYQASHPFYNILSRERSSGAAFPSGPTMVYQSYARYLKSFQPCAVKEHTEHLKS